jgi:F-type H+-transporting ATPase subunit b
MYCFNPWTAGPCRLRFMLIVWLGIAWCGGMALAAGIAQGAEDQPSAKSNASDSVSHAEAKPGEPEANPNPLVFKTDLAIWTFAVFVVLFLVLKKFAWGPITLALDRREQHIAENIEAAKQAQEGARSMLAEYERKLASAADQVREMLEEARRDAEHAKQDILNEAKTAAKAEHDRALRDIRTAADAAVKDLSQRSADLAVEMAGKFISAKLTPDERSRLVQDSLSKFAAAAPSKN